MRMELLLLNYQSLNLQAPEFSHFPPLVLLATEGGDVENVVAVHW